MMQTQIIYEDDTLFVVYKPAGLATQSARVTQADVVSELNNYLAAKNNGKTPYLGLIHRLDQPVEGLLVFAKDKKAAANLSSQLSVENKQCEKAYRAVVYLDKKDGTETGQTEPLKKENLTGREKASADGFRVLTDYLVKDSRVNLAKVVSKDTAQAKKAVLSYRVLKVIEDLALVEIRLQTGRFHQIRAQLSHAGMPLLGDQKYGSEVSSLKSQHLQVKTVALCANRLTFVHPKTNKTLSYKIEPRNPVFEIMK